MLGMLMVTDCLKFVITWKNSDQPLQPVYLNKAFNMLGTSCMSNLTSMIWWIRVIFYGIFRQFRTLQIILWQRERNLI